MSSFLISNQPPVPVSAFASISELFFGSHVAHSGKCSLKSVFFVFKNSSLKAFLNLKLSFIESTKYALLKFAFVMVENSPLAIK